MRDNNFQIGGSGNNQKIINNHKQKSWQDNIALYIAISIIAAVLSLAIAKHFGL